MKRRHRRRHMIDGLGQRKPKEYYYLTGCNLKSHSKKEEAIQERICYSIFFLAHTCDKRSKHTHTRLTDTHLRDRCLLHYLLLLQQAKKKQQQMILKKSRIIVKNRIISLVSNHPSKNTADIHTDLQAGSLHALSDGRRTRNTPMKIIRMIC